MLISGFIRMVEAKILAFMAYRRTLREMAQFSERDLADMHTNAGEIQRLAREEAVLVENYVTAHQGGLRLAA